MRNIPSIGNQLEIYHPSIHSHFHYPSTNVRIFDQYNQCRQSVVEPRFLVVRFIDSFEFAQHILISFGPSIHHWHSRPIYVLHSHLPTEKVLLQSKSQTIQLQTLPINHLMTCHHEVLLLDSVNSMGMGWRSSEGVVMSLQEVLEEDLPARTITHLMLLFITHFILLFNCQNKIVLLPVSYTHLTLPTIYSV